MNEKEFKIELQEETINLIRKEIDSIPSKFHIPFHSNHEGYAVFLEEVKELEAEIFWGDKKIKIENKGSDLSPEFIKQKHKERIREEAIQVAAMAIRIIQELT